MNKRQKKNVSEDRLIITQGVTRSINLENGSNNSLPIPIEILISIFAKLELKSIARCRCVLKLWASILRRSDFTELFLSRSRSSSPKLLFAYEKNRKLFFFSSPQPQNPDNKLSLVISNHQIKFSVGHLLYIERVHGLIYLEDFQMLEGKQDTILKICNPSTGQVLILPKVKTRRHSWWNLLGYDPIVNQFKVLSMTLPLRSRDLVCGEYQVLTLSNGNMSWKMIECCTPHYRPRKHICINGVVYYTSTDRLRETCLIVSFGVRFEKFNFIKTTGMIKRAISDETMELINYNGNLGLLQCEEDVRFVFWNGRSLRYNLWVLEDLEKQEWSDHRFLFPTVPRNIVGQVRFVGVTKTNEIVLSSCYKHYPFDLFYLNLEKKTMVRVTIQGIEDFMVEHNGIGHIFLDHVEDVKLY